MIARFIRTMDFNWENIEILNVENEEELMQKIKDSEVIKVRNSFSTYGLNSSYIIHYML